MGWGGNPEKDALYLPVTPFSDDGTTVYRLRRRTYPSMASGRLPWETARDIFRRRYTRIDRTLCHDQVGDGSVTVQFGGCDGRSPTACQSSRDGAISCVCTGRAPRLKTAVEVPQATPVKSVISGVCAGLGRLFPALRQDVCTRRSPGREARPGVRVRAGPSTHGYPT